MDHEIDLESRLTLDDYTIPVSDQLLTKLQVHKQDEKDVRDVLTLLKDLELADEEAPGVIGLSHVASRCAEDWGLYHDVERSLTRRRRCCRTTRSPTRTRGASATRLARLRRALEDAPKSRALEAARQGRRTPSVAQRRRGAGRGLVSGPR